MIPPKLFLLFLFHFCTASVFRASTERTQYEIPDKVTNSKTCYINGDPYLDTIYLDTNGLVFLYGTITGEQGDREVVFMENSLASSFVCGSFTPSTEFSQNVIVGDPMSNSLKVFQYHEDSVRRTLDYDQILNHKIDDKSAFGKSLASGDFNQDGLEDLLVTDPGTHTAHLFLSNTTHPFAATKIFFASGAEQFGAKIFVEDVVEDSHLDLIVSAIQHEDVFLVFPGLEGGLLGFPIAVQGSDYANPISSEYLKIFYSKTQIENQQEFYFIRVEQTPQFAFGYKRRSSSPSTSDMSSTTTDSTTSTSPSTTTDSSTTGTTSTSTSTTTDSSTTGTTGTTYGTSASTTDSSGTTGTTDGTSATTGEATTGTTDAATTGSGTSATTGSGTSGTTGSGSGTSSSGTSATSSTASSSGSTDSSSTTDTSSSSSSNSTTDDGSSEGNGSGGSATAAAAGGAAGGGTCLIIVVGLVFWWRRKKKTDDLTSSEEEDELEAS